MPKFRKKPVVVEAIQVTNNAVQAVKLARWCRGHWSPDSNPDGSGMSQHIIIPTLEGKMVASEGDWIIKGVSGEFYPCKDDIFRKTYEPVEQESGGFRATVILPVDNAEDASYMLYELYRYGVGGVDNGEKIAFEIDGKQAGVFD